MTTVQYTRQKLGAARGRLVVEQGVELEVELAVELAAEPALSAVSKAIVAETGYRRSLAGDQVPTEEIARRGIKNLSSTQIQVDQLAGLQSLRGASGL
jgi:hypothetical protein